MTIYKINIRLNIVNSC